MKLISTLFLLLMLQMSSAQNLIPNPGFEDVNVCEVFEERCTPKAWRNVLLKAFQFPQMGKYDKTSMGARPKEGFRSAIIPLYHKNRKNDRIYIQVPFLFGLEKGREYDFSFHYLLTEEATQNFGIIFSDSLFIRTNINDLVGRKPSIEIPLLENPQYNQWVEFKINYIAKGGEQGIIVGNFTKDEEIEYQRLVKLKKKTFYPKRMMIWLDEFNLSPTDSRGINCDLEYNRAAIYDDSIRHYIKDLAMSSNINNPFVFDENNRIQYENHNHSQEKEDTIVLNKENILEKEEELVLDIRLNESFILEKVAFEMNSVNLLEESYPSLNKLLIYLQENETYRISITGFTDNIGSKKYHLSLSKKRAGTVAAYLIRKGISLDRITSSGKGEEDPIGDNNTEEGRAKNRRVEFLIITE